MSVSARARPLFFRTRILSSFQHKCMWLRRWHFHWRFRERIFFVVLSVQCTVHTHLYWSCIFFTQFVAYLDRTLVCSPARSLGRMVGRSAGLTFFVNTRNCVHTLCLNSLEKRSKVNSHEKNRSNNNHRPSVRAIEEKTWAYIVSTRKCIIALFAKEQSLLLLFIY